MADLTFTTPRPAHWGQNAGQMTDVLGHAHGRMGKSIVARVFKPDVMWHGTAEYAVFMPSALEVIWVKRDDVKATVSRAIAMREVQGITEYALYLEAEQAHREAHDHDGHDCMCFEADDAGSPFDAIKRSYNEYVQHKRRSCMRLDKPEYDA